MAKAIQVMVEGMLKGNYQNKMFESIRASKPVISKIKSAWDQLRVLHIQDGKILRRIILK